MWSGPPSLRLPALLTNNCLFISVPPGLPAGTHRPQLNLPLSKFCILTLYPRSTRPFSPESKPRPCADRRWTCCFNFTHLCISSLPHLTSAFTNQGPISLSFPFRACSLSMFSSHCMHCTFSPGSLGRTAFPSPRSSASFSLQWTQWWVTFD